MAVITVAIVLTRTDGTAIDFNPANMQAWTVLPDGTTRVDCVGTNGYPGPEYYTVRETPAQIVQAIADAQA